MPFIQDHRLIKIYAQLANAMSVSLASAKRIIEQKASKDGNRTLEYKIELAKKLLSDLDKNKSDDNILDKLLEVSEEDANFMLED